MDINLDSLDNITQLKYKEFKEKIAGLLMTYQEIDTQRFDLVRKRIEQTNGNWNTTINLISGEHREDVEISQLLAYEYCLASEKITKGKVSFESALNKLFDGVQKFRIGNPVPGMDDECLYGKSFDDEATMPVTSKLYRMVMNAEAQHLGYFKDGIFTGAVFIYERGTIKAIAKDELGKSVDMEIAGIDFRNLSGGQSLLTKLRQSVFHEWTHNSEKETIQEAEDNIDYEYQGPDGKIYRNYERINSYVTSENIDTIQEPQYIISSQRDSQGNKKRYFQNINGKLRPLNEVRFGLEKMQLENDYCFSSGLKTIEVLPNGEVKMHNIITEGFVEETARAMIRAIDPQVIDIDEERYPEYVEIAKKVIESRDFSLGATGQGQTYADFLMNSSLLKRDLESKTVELNNGNKVDGLHYISNYADSVQNGQTRKAQFYRNMPNIARKLNLSNTQMDAVRSSKLLARRALTEAEQKRLKTLLIGKNPNNEAYADIVLSEFVDILGEESEFYNGIAEKLGYKERTIANEKTIKGLVEECIMGVPDFTQLDDIEQAQMKQQEQARQGQSK